MDRSADEVLAGLDLTGRTALVTGGCSGLGRETTAAARLWTLSAELTGHDGFADRPTRAR
ncbi:hypothetical protein [Nocardia jinanensis]|uniref:Short chain dehydrogenase n=1 Tax=Nocardia jinanensis TaxID=382504 RepID=A0A917VKR2_9NOCA|nr:hypothetical protein [Nocardia jinanensis]GGK91100.1 hypothetical protein GCM10011588_01770 [Nocardia jinanensis]